MPLIQLDYVTKTYKQKLVLDAVSLSIDQGEFWTIHGKSGAGKSTLLNLLGLIDSFDEGTVSLFGKSAPKINSKAALLLRRNKISYLFQNHGLIEDETIMDNLNIPFIYQKTRRREKNQAAARSSCQGFLRLSIENKSLSSFWRRKATPSFCQTPTRRQRTDPSR